MNTWTNNLYHNEKGLVLGSVSEYEYNGQIKAVLGKDLIGWFINERFAKLAVEEAYKNEKSGV